MVKEVKLINKNLNEPLLLGYFPGNPDSPTVGQIQALTYMRNGESIPEDIERSVILASERQQERLENTILQWNEGVRKGMTMPFVSAYGLRCLIAVSYGQLEGLEKRAELIDLAMNGICKKETLIQ